VFTREDPFMIVRSSIRNRFQSISMKIIPPRLTPSDRINREELELCLRGSPLTGHFAVNCVGAAAVSNVMEILPTVLLFAIFGFGIVLSQCIAAKPVSVAMDSLAPRAVDEVWMVSASSISLLAENVVVILQQQLKPLSPNDGDFNRLAMSSLVFSSDLSPQVRVINEGFPGENTAELDARLDRVLDQSKPEYVVLFVGANDALNEKKFFPIGETERHLEAMVRRTKKRGAVVIMVTVHDPDLSRLMARHSSEAYGDTPPLERLAMVNDRIRRIAQMEHAQLVPFDTVLLKAGRANVDLSTDGVHLTARGYGILASAVREQLPKQLPANATILCFGDSLTYGIGVRSANSLSETDNTYPAQLRALLNE
jgi:acyl-CoA thioesterase-1